LDPPLDRNTQMATLEWLVTALEYARTRGQTKVVGYLEEVADEVVFEVEAAREPGYLLSHRM
jgi:hypothetical protein